MTSPFEFHDRIVIPGFIFGVAYPNRSKLRGMRNPFLDQNKFIENIAREDPNLHAIKC